MTSELSIETLVQELTALRAAASAVPELSFNYVNYAGRESIRHVKVLGIRYGTTDYYQIPGWLIRAWDTDKGAEREFSIRNMAPTESTLTPNYDQQQIISAAGELGKSVQMLMEALLTTSGKAHGAYASVGGAFDLLERNMHRLALLKQRLAGTSQEPFTWVKPPLKNQNQEQTNG